LYQTGDRDQYFRLKEQVVQMLQADPVNFNDFNFISLLNAMLKHNDRDVAVLQLIAEIAWRGKSKRPKQKSSTMT